MPIGDGEVGEWLGYEGEALINEINILVEESPKNSYPFVQVRIQQEVCNPEEGLHQPCWYLISDFQPPEL